MYEEIYLVLIITIISTTSKLAGVGIYAWTACSTAAEPTTRAWLPAAWTTPLITRSLNLIEEK